jgi:predicted ATP-grasp superfamily ATP-dependent carboligase
MFFQWIEGPREEVTRLMDSIRRDPRHERVVMLGETEEVRERLFPDWSMELVAPGDIRPVLQDALASAKDAKSTAALCLLLAQFDAERPDPGAADH